MTVPHTNSTSVENLDVVIVGGGLSGILLAIRLRQVRPDVRFIILERGRLLGGNHTWSFHDPDITPAQRMWLQPLVTYRWHEQEVRFSAGQRVLRAGYNSIASEDLRRRVAPIIGDRVLYDAIAKSLTPASVTLADGRELHAPCVIDARGLPPADALALGFQKFVGLEVETAEAHGRHRPIIMDATVDQSDGYRFVYTLPLTRTRILIEDTYYSDHDTIDAANVEQRIDTYARSQGWTIANVVRREVGTLPIVLAGDADAFWPAGEPPIPRIGLRAGLFHPTTGYSLPDAALTAGIIAAEPDLSSARLHALIRQRSRAAWADRSFFRLLNRFLFIAASPRRRVDVMARFYRLPEHVIENFYAARLTLADRARIVTGKPTVPMMKALACLSSDSAWAFVRDRAAAQAAAGRRLQRML